MSTGGVTNAQGVAATNATSGSGGGIGLKAAGILAQNGVQVSVTGTTAATVLATIPIPGGTLTSNGVLRITSLWSYTNSANNKILQAIIGGSNFMNVTATTTAALNQINVIRNRNALNSQVAFQATFPGGYGNTTIANLTTSIDFSQAQTLTLVGTLALSTETINLEGYTIEVLNP